MIVILEFFSYLFLAFACIFNSICLSKLADKVHDLEEKKCV